MTSQAIIQDSNATVTTIIGPGTLEISSSPSGAKIYVNGEYKRVTPLTLSLMPGTYEVRITKDGYEDYTGMVGVKTGETRSISVTLKPVYGFLSVNSNPPGAEVYINGNYAGTTPLEDYKLSPGEYEVKIKKDGYEEYSKIVTITAGKTTTFSALLTPIPQSSSTTTSITSTTSSTSPTPSSSPTSTSKTSPQTATSSTSPRETSTAVSSSNLNPYYIVGALIGLLLIGGIVSKTKSRKSKKAEKPEKLPETMEKTPRYEALGNYLSKLDKSNVTLKFDEIERIIGGKLPDSARKHRAWWGNDRSHSHAVKGWLNAGWKVKRVDFERGLVEFERSTRVEVKKPEEQPTQEIKKPALLESLVLGFPSALLERYEPLEFLGEGGFAKVFKVKRKSDGKVVALKIPRIDEKTSKTFIKEVSTWLHLNHPNIVKLYDVDILPIPYLEMEYVEGVNMNGKTIRDLGAYPKPVDEKTALKLIRSIAEGLKYAHGKGIYHRDLKPLNILLKSDLMPKITDWGLAKLGTMSSRRSVLGYTPLYASPEHLMPSKYGHTDHRTDIWQLGVTFYELLTGKLPFEGYTYEEVFGKIVDEGYRFTPPSKINPALAKYDGIFEKLLAKRKENRYQSVDELLKDLEKLEEAEKRKKQLEKEVEKLRETLSKSVQALKRSTTPEEALRNRRLVVETLGKLVLAYAELNNKAELLNTLNDLKFYTVQNLADLTSAINAVALLIREGLPVSEDFMERLKVLVHNIKRENGA
ncbi:hypothetical protein DRN44_06785 [Thermococci archaeon]|nr:MAG: hypothetical protein DRN44_06785 [Thermococci archaeon]